MSEGLKSEVAKREEEILAFWKENRIFEKSLEKPAPMGDFVFYDGPPFATGLPHTGSMLSSIIKDVVPRYKTMRGYRVPRRWGWDCHGLPIESMVEKELGLKTKKDIVAIGLEVFNEKARSMVLQYVHDWEKYVDRVGRWVDFKNSYKTMDNSYIESVWWALKRLNEKNLLYEGRKVLMYCTHCETPLAKAEIAQDNTYKDITEEAVTVKFKVKNPQKYKLPENTFLLAWTTTPWTLPGNVGLAVGPDIPYGLIEHGGQHLLVTKEDGEFRGKDLVGIEYEPFFDVPALQSKKSYKVWGADFVTTSEGTGIVHTAVMYGEDDFALGQKESLPMVQLLNPNGTYNELAPEFIRGEYIKKAEKLIKEELERRGLIYARAAHTHSYPHCYRCGTPLIYNAVPSWFINIQKIKQKLISENEKITWVPGHLKHGRFKNILESAPDWTISRNRFWASPLPMWKEKNGKGLMVVGSLEELLAKTQKSGNRYFVMRHGEARNNVESFMDSTDDIVCHLTEKGRREVEIHASDLKKRSSVDLIIVSPLVRTQETARIVQKEFALPESAFMTDERLRERGMGEANGKPLSQWQAQFPSFTDEFTTAPGGAETLIEMRKRIGDFLFELERRYVNKHILIVTHGDPFWIMRHTAGHTDLQDLLHLEEPERYPTTAQWEELLFTPYPHNANYELDLHRPYIDGVVLVDEKGNKYERIPEVVDCWVESGSMPFASAGYPRDTSVIDPERMFGFSPKGYPGDFIAEYIAQTRTWFYYMHAMGIALFSGIAFRSVVTTGTILAADGSKMSKSKGNYTDPLNIMEQFGADALRFHLMSSVVMQAEDLNFRDEDVREAQNRVLGILWNCYKFLELYREQYGGSARAPDSTHVLDRWICSLLSSATREVTEALDAYDLPRATRALRSFVEDYSTWYVRRSRDRAKGEGEDVQYTLATQLHVLFNLARLFAPVTPFIADSIYRGLGGKEESVHLAPWPEADRVDEKLLADMQLIRELASRGLQLREQAGIKVRQPLASFKAKSLPSDPMLLKVLAEELNVKEVVQDETLTDDTQLITELTPQLREEGKVRDFVRQIQEWRKSENLTIADRPDFTLVVNAEDEPVAQKYRAEIIAATGLKDLKIEIHA